MVEDFKQSEKLFAAFLAPRKIMIADPNPASRAGLARIIIGFGAKTNNLLLVDSFEGASELIQTVQPEILVVDYGIGNSRGINLSMETKNYTNQDEKIFIIVAADTSQSAVAMAAEEDVDVYILKPYTMKGFSDTLMKAVLVKIYPNDYIKAINSGKKKLEAQDPDGAIQEFEKAAALKDKAALAYYYRAQAELFKKLLGEAEGSYNIGLQANSLHYKCLTGFFDLLMSQKRNVDAYSVVKQIAKFFPANPNRLGQILSLAISTGNFDDIDEYYTTFKDLDIRNDDLIKYVCASLVICGKHFFRQNQKEKALEFLKNASITAAGRTFILREIVATLTENGFRMEAQEVLRRFPKATKNEIHYKIAELLIRNLLEPQKLKLMPEMRSMVHVKVNEPIIWYWYISYLVKFEKFDEADKICDEAIVLWPDKVEYFNQALDDELKT